MVQKQNKPLRVPVIVDGVVTAAFNAGTKTTGTFRPRPTPGNMQYYINGGAHILLPPDMNGDYVMIVQSVNNASAGAIDTSAFDAVSGAIPSTVDGEGFRFHITKLNGIVTAAVEALQ